MASMTGSALAVLLMVSAAQGQPRQLTTPGTVWTYSADNWDPRGVSLGNHGTQVFLGRFTNPFLAPHAALLSAHDTGTAHPVWESALSAELVLMSDSARTRDVHVVITEENTTTVNQRIRRVQRFSSAGLDWTFTYPHLGAGRAVVGVTRTGDRIVAALGNPQTGENDVLVFGPDSPVPVQSYPVPGGTLWSFDLSDSGSHALFGIHTEFHVLDLTSGGVHEVYDHAPFWLNTIGAAISGDGRRVVAGVAGGVALFEWDGASYRRAWSRLHGEPRAVDVSRDGSTAAYGIGGGVSSGFVAECVDLVERRVTMTDEVLGSGAYPNGFSDISITETGELFAAATWGDEFDLVQEVRIYHARENRPVQLFDLPGSAVHVDISADGSFVVVGSLPTHLSQASTGGRVDLYHMGRSDLALKGVPRIGGQVRFEVFGERGDQAFLLDAPELAPFPLPFGDGLLWLQPDSVHVTWVGEIGAAGSRTVGRALPTSLASLGVSHYFQGATWGPRRSSTRDWIVVTYLP